MLLHELYALQDLFLGLLAKSGKIYKPVLPAGIFQFTNACDGECLEKKLYLSRPEIGYPG